MNEGEFAPLLIRESRPLTPEFLITTWDYKTLIAYRSKLWGQAQEGSEHIRLLPRFLELPELEPARRILLKKGRQTGHEWSAVIDEAGMMYGLKEGTDFSAHRPTGELLAFNGGKWQGLIHSHPPSIPGWTESIVGDIGFMAGQNYFNFSPIAEPRGAMVLLTPADYNPPMPNLGTVIRYYSLLKKLLIEGGLMRRKQKD